MLTSPTCESAHATSGWTLLLPTSDPPRRTTLARKERRWRIAYREPKAVQDKRPIVRRAPRREDQINSCQHWCWRRLTNAPHPGVRPQHRTGPVIWVAQLHHHLDSPVWDPAEPWWRHAVRWETPRTLWRIQHLQDPRRSRPTPAAVPLDTRERGPRAITRYLCGHWTLEISGAVRYPDGVRSSSGHRAVLLPGTSAAVRAQRRRTFPPDGCQIIRWRGSSSMCSPAPAVRGASHPADRRGGPPVTSAAKRGGSDQTGMCMMMQGTEGRTRGMFHCLMPARSALEHRQEFL